MLWKTLGFELLIFRLTPVSHSGDGCMKYKQLLHQLLQVQMKLMVVKLKATHLRNMQGFFS